MNNLYGLIVVLLGLIGIFLLIRSWKNISKANLRSKWPKVEGLIASCSNTAVGYRYEVGKTIYDGTLAIQGNDIAMPSDADNQLKKYTVDAKVKVAYDPENPANSTLEPDAGKDELLVFWLVAGSLVTGLIFIILKL